MIAEVRYLAPGTCTFVASVTATSTTEAAEVSQSVKVIARPGPPEKPGQPVPTIPEIALGSQGPGPVTESLGTAYLGEARDVEAKSARPGLRVVSVMPPVCTVGPAPLAPAAVSPRAFAVQLTLLTTGTCTLTASLPKTAEHDAVEVTKSLLVESEGERPPPPGSIPSRAPPGRTTQPAAEANSTASPTKAEKTRTKVNNTTTTRRKTSATSAIPAKVRTVLYNDVLAAVATKHITNVGTIWVVAATLAKTGFGAFSGPGSTPVYVVAWSGHKELDCKHPQGRTCEGLHAFELGYSAGDLVFVGGGSFSKYPVALHDLGNPVRLVKPRTSQHGSLTGTIAVHLYWMGVPDPQLSECPSTTRRAAGWCLWMRLPTDRVHCAMYL